MDNPYSADTNPNPDSNKNPPSSGSKSEPASPGLAAYNITSDIVAGLNVRKRDNLYQGLFILAAVALGAIVGVICALIRPDWNLPWIGGALVGGFAGLVLGFFSSGIFLMVYRAVRHMRGKHD